jgi:hypothetical protein
VCAISKVESKVASINTSLRYKRNFPRFRPIKREGIRHIAKVVGSSTYGRLEIEIEKTI